MAHVGVIPQLGAFNARARKDTARGCRDVRCDAWNHLFVGHGYDIIRAAGPPHQDYDLLDTRNYKAFLVPFSHEGLQNYSDPLERAELSVDLKGAVAYPLSIWTPMRNCYRQHLTFALRDPRPLRETHIRLLTEPFKDICSMNWLFDGVKDDDPERGSADDPPCAIAMAQVSGKRIAFFPFPLSPDIREVLGGDTLDSILTKLGRIPDAYGGWQGPGREKPRNSQFGSETRQVLGRIFVPPTGLSSEEWARRSARNGVLRCAQCLGRDCLVPTPGCKDCADMNQDGTGGKAEGQLRGSICPHGTVDDQTCTTDMHHGEISISNDQDFQNIQELTMKVTKSKLTETLQAFRASGNIALQKDDDSAYIGKPFVEIVVRAPARNPNDPDLYDGLPPIPVENLTAWGGGMLGLIRMKGEPLLPQREPR